MIKIENFDVFNFEGAIRGMRNPMESWDKSDSMSCDGVLYCENCSANKSKSNVACGKYSVGKSDMKLMQKLYKAGSDHSKFMRQIFVSMDITAPLYWWKEFDTYKVGTVANSCSTMHTIHKRDLTIDDLSHEHLVKPALEILQNLLTALNEVRCAYVNYDNWDGREDFEKQGYKKKDLWWQMIQLLPSAYNQKRTVTMSYANIAAMIKARSHHKLDEWITFCSEMLNNAPYLAEIIKGEEDDWDGK